MLLLLAVIWTQLLIAGKAVLSACRVIEPFSDNVPPWNDESVVTASRAAPAL